MFRGYTKLSLDAKGRIAIPSRYRDEIAGLGGGQVVVTISALDRCLWLYPLDNWLEVENTVLELPGMQPSALRLRKLLIGHAHDIELDGSGRILLPATLREFAGLDKDISLLGQLNRFDIWNTSLWEARRDELLAQDPLAGPLPVELESVSF